MEVKKTKRANIEKSKSIFTLIGLIISLSFVWFSFEYKTYDKTNNNLQAIDLLIDDGDIIMQTERPKPIPPPPPKAISVIEVIENTEKNVPDIDITIETSTIEDIQKLIEPEPDEVEYAENEVFVFLQNKPEFKGGERALHEYLKKNIKYPVYANEINIQGIVYVTFIVEKDGSISNIRLLRGIGGGCDEEALRVVSNMPPWNPGKQRGRKVRAQFNMPIKFILR